MAIPDHVFQDLKEVHPELSEHLDKCLMHAKELRANRPNTMRTDPNPNACERYTYDANHTTTMPGALKAEENTHTDGLEPEVAQAHANANVVRQFWKEVAGRNSLDDKGVDMRSVAKYDKDYDNAFQTENDGEPIMVYGSGKIFLPLCQALDVAGHEMGHAVVAAEAGLIYFGASGALNEHFADVFGECVEQWARGKKIAEASWLMGEDIMSPDLKSKGWQAIRTFKQGEKAYPSDPQPDTYQTRYIGFDDNGGVHINSKLGNAAFYNFCINGGFEHVWEEPFQVWYAALKTLNKLSGFRALKKATLKVCQAKYPDKVSALEQAFKSVGL